jgi:hypothetical protein
MADGTKLAGLQPHKEDEIRIEKRERKRQLGIPRPKLEDNIKTDLI